MPEMQVMLLPSVDGVDSSMVVLAPVSMSRIQAITTAKNAIEEVKGDLPDSWTWPLIRERLQEAGLVVPSEQFNGPVWNQ